ncbi:MAG: class I SAM-dependent methyltransferase [Methanotrichaceae archaeon]
MQREFLAIVVPKKEAQRIVQNVNEAGLLDHRRKVLQRDDFVEIPVTTNLQYHEIVHQVRPEFYKITPGLDDILKGKITLEESALLPRGWYILGDVIIVKIHPRLENLRGIIGDALLTIYPQCKCVLRDSGIKGQFREPRREVIAGSGTETVHKENGVIFKLDAMRLMFSPGNLLERMRMSRLGKNEIVVDMFAGIGYFSLPMAVHSRPERIVSIELNPVAHKYLVENVRLNRVEDIVEPMLGDCSKKTPDSIADRVIMGFVGFTDRYLSTGIKALRHGGVLHYHQTVPEKLYPATLEKDVTETAHQEGRRVQILRCARVKKYSPGMLHAVLDARIE